MNTQTKSTITNTSTSDAPAPLAQSQPESESAAHAAPVAVANKPGTCALPSSANTAAALPVAIAEQPALIETRPLPSPARKRKIRRHGRIASLPRLERDMVNHMLWNAVPYKNIVAALDEQGYTVTERNISNWATGGYLEWSLAQEHVLQNRRNQDHLLDFLRRDDAPELPEVGLQAAATRLSQVFLQKLAQADNPEAHLDSYSKMVDLLCRLNRELATTQKVRDDSRRTLGPEYDPVRVKETDKLNAIEHERFYSDPPSDSNLPKPSAPPFLPVTPTDALAAYQAQEERDAADLAREKHKLALLKAVAEKTVAASKQTRKTRAMRRKRPQAQSPVG